MKKYLCVLFTIFVSSCAVAGAEQSPENILEVAQGTHSLYRELDYREPCDIVLADTARTIRFTEMISGSFAETEQSLERRERIWRFLGMVDDNYALAENVPAFREAQTRSIYNPENRTIYIDTGRGIPGWNAPLLKRTMKQLDMGELEFTLGLETAYALLDQNFGVLTQDYEGLTFDEIMARRAVADGGAVVMGSEYLVRDTGINILVLPNLEAVIRQFISLVTYIDDDLLAASPESVQSYITFPYLEGTSFIMYHKKSGGNELLDAAYKSPPVSTEMILHPEKYFEKRDNPIKIRLRDYGDILDGWSLLQEDTYGELGLRMMLEAHLGTGSDAGSAAEGWAGDSVAFFESPGGRLAAAWYTTWDSAEEADMFASALTRAARLMRGPANFDSKRIGRDVAFTIGVPEEKKEAAMNRLWESAKVPVMSPPPVPEKPDPVSLVKDMRSFISMFTDESAPTPADDPLWQDLGDTFRNLRYGYEVTRPGKEWHFQRIHLGGLVLSEFTAMNTKELGSNFTVYSFEKYAPGAPDNPVNEMVTFMSRQMHGFKKIGEDNELTVDGHPARSVTFSGVALMPLTITYTEVFAGDYNYVITFWTMSTSYKKLLPELLEFRDSFRVIERKE